jgi:hypothetical protein
VSWPELKNKNRGTYCSFECRCSEREFFATWFSDNYGNDNDDYNNNNNNNNPNKPWTSSPKIAYMFPEKREEED